MATETTRRVPNSITEAVEEYAAFNRADAVGMTDEEIRTYFTQENFWEMFGEDGDISHWPWTFEELAETAISLRDAENR
jgi:hypothetical protein